MYIHHVVTVCQCQMPPFINPYGIEKCPLGAHFIISISAQLVVTLYLKGCA